MQCINCGSAANRLVFDKYGTGCENCRNMSATGGSKLDGILTRSSERVRAQQQEYEGDMIAPHVFDKVLGRMVVNPDFVDRYSDQLPTYFTQEELEHEGFSKAAKIYEKKAAQEAAHEKERAEIEYATEGAQEKIVETIENI